MAELLLSEEKGVKTYLVENTKWGATTIRKVLDNQYPSDKQVREFLYEFKLLSELNIPGIRTPLGQDDVGEKPAAYYQYFDGFPLKKLIENGKNDLDLALNAGIFLAETLSRIHDNNVIHKNISSNSILYNAKSQEFCLIDFSCASTIKQKIQLQGSPDIINGDLDYISPEQTGRMNRRVDHRSDLYSIGIVLYELFTGTLPFPEEDARQTVYGHIAVLPKSPYEQNSRMPEQLSNIIMKLLEKDADVRYQSATGLKLDLQRIQAEIIKGESSIFALGEFDKSIALTISQKLYGREKEIEELSSHLDSVAQGEFGIDMVYGHSGSGKSSLVHEVFKSISKTKGYFISGKFDQLQRNIPYYAIRQALKEYFNFLLTEDGEYIDQVREEILSAVGNEGGLIIEIIPELEHIIGRQAKVNAATGVAGQNQLNYVFNKFLGAITALGHPIILFIDDLQWADLASLNLISNIIRGQQVKYLLLIGSFRENEVSETHPLSQLITSSEKDGVNISHIRVENLKLVDIIHLLCDTLGHSEEQVSPLAKILFNHTDGNAFYVTQIIQSLFDQEFLFFDEAKKGWMWDEGIISKMEIADNVVDLMIQRIKRLDASTQNLLKKGSCIGNTFLISDLELLLDSSASEFETELINAQEEGLIFEDQETYRFLHDRIQQAVYSLIPDTEKEKIHYEFGLQLMERSAGSDEKIFDIVDQLNFGLDIVTNETERLNFAAYNLKAGKLAKASTAYDASLGYFNKGLKFSANDWSGNYPLLLDLHTNAAEAAYLMAKYDDVDLHINEVLKNGTQLLDKIPVYKIEVEALKSQNNLVAAVEKGLEALEKLNVKLPYKPSKAFVFANLASTRIKMVGKGPESLIRLKEMEDPHMLAAMQILVSIGPAIYWASPNLTPLTIFEMLLISVRHGNTDESTFAYSTYGLFLCGVTGEINLGNRYGQLTLELVNKVNPINKVKGIFNVYCFVHHWSHPLSDSFNPFQEAHQLGQAAGDLEFSALSGYLYCNHAFYAGKPLFELEHNFKIYSDEIRRIKQYTPLNYTLLHWQVAHNLMYETSNPVELSGPIYSEQDMLQVHEKANDKTALFKFHLLKMMLNYLFGNVIQAFEHGLKGAEYLDAVTGMYVTVEYHFYYGLVLAAKLGIGTDQNNEKKKLASIIKKFKKWALHSPDNNKHKYELLKAELLNVSEKPERARTYYKEAIKSAKKSRFLNESALASELTGKHYLKENEGELALFFLANSFIAYQEWGAITKCNELKIGYKLDAFLGAYLKEYNQDIAVGSSSNSLEKLDISTITEAAETISDEIQFDQLKTTLLKIIAENAGAEKAILFIVDNKKASVGESWPDQRIDTQSFPSSVIDSVLEDGELVVTDRALSDAKFMEDEHVLKNEVRSALCMPLLHQNELIAIIYLENNLVYGSFSQNRLEFLKLMSGQMAISIKNAALYQNLTDAYDEQVKLKDAYGKFVPKAFLKFLGKDSILDVTLGDQIQRTVTIMFIDIVDYTSMSEKMTPKENFDFINGCLKILGPVLRSHGGFISQFLGDGAMAIFKGKPDSAVDAAIDIQKTLRDYNLKRGEKQRSPVRVGIGIHTGKVMLGIIGEEMRMDQNVISDAVNIASRVQDLTRTYHTSIIITGATMDALTTDSNTKLRYLGKAGIKGREDQVEIYDCLDGLAENDANPKIKTTAIFNNGIQAMSEKNFEEASKFFRLVLKENPDDLVSEMFLEHSEKNAININ